jgi:MFS family permease
MANVPATRRGLIGGTTGQVRTAIFASSLGTIFEWYDFFLYGSLAATIGAAYFPAVNPAASWILALLAFAAGFAVRPFGAIIFGRIGRLVGRRHAFVIATATIGLSTFLVGLLPGYAAIGLAAPVVLILLRLLQGLALGGEYGGAAVWIAEHAPRGKRGLYSSWVQTTATLGLLLSLVVILGCREWIGARSFDAWGWRIPFLLSIALLAVSVYVRLRLDKSLLFQRVKAPVRRSSAPLTETFAEKRDPKLLLIALFGATAGQGVVWYCGQVYALYFLTRTLEVDPTTAMLMIAAALAIGTPGFILFGWLSDRVGRKPIIMLGCLLAVVTYLPLFKAITHYANPALEAAIASSPVVVIADPHRCPLLLFDPVDTAKFTTPCDVAKSALVARGIPYSNEAAPPGSTAQVKIGATAIASYDPEAADAAAKAAAFTHAVADALKTTGYPPKADPARINHVRVIVLLVILMSYVTLVYGPIAAMLVELFPTRTRDTSVSLPYHIGSGLGGFLPVIAFAIVATTGNIYDGLWYPLAIAAMTLVVGVLFLRETRDVDIQAF